MSLLTKLRAEDLSVEELQEMVGPKIAANTRWMRWDELASIPSYRELFTKPVILVLLSIEARDAPSVGHFIVLIDFKDYIEHFDSYGLTMEEELKITHEKHLSRLFKDYRKPIVNNTKRLQTLRQDVNTCGRWCVIRIMLQSMKLEEFLKFLALFHTWPDNVAVALTFLLQVR